jgi:uncharacterized membrane protein
VPISYHRTSKIEVGIKSKAPAIRRGFSSSNNASTPINQRDDTDMAAVALVLVLALVLALVLVLVLVLVLGFLVVILREAEDLLLHLQLHWLLLSRDRDQHPFKSILYLVPHH